MKNLVFTSVAFATIAAGPGMAADMTPFPAAAPAPAYSRTSMMARPYDWTGFYIGGHARYSRANSNSTTINTATGAVDVSGSGSTTNLHGGGQIGFDYTMPSRIVIGVLADVSTGEDHTTTFQMQPEPTYTRTRAKPMLPEPCAGASVTVSTTS